MISDCVCKRGLAPPVLLYHSILGLPGSLSVVVRGHRHRQQAPGFDFETNVEGCFGDPGLGDRRGLKNSRWQYNAGMLQAVKFVSNNVRRG
ncbi:hypothetical protein BDR04DRAFT_1106800 [Suillus decipiens]|nr:hypothetical protein BDR04DRAFT_1106800 [Suillus decipiens]